MKMSKLFLAALFMSLISLAIPVFADTTYTYTGNPFSLANNDDGVTTSDYVSGSFSLSTPLAPNMGLTLISASDITSFDFSDGVHSFTIPSSIYVATGSNGSITNWEIDSLATISGGYTIQLFSDNYSPNFFDETTWYYSSRNQSGWAYIFNHSGTWTVADPTDTPEPSSLLLLSSGLVGLGFMKRKLFQN